MKTSHKLLSTFAGLAVAATTVVSAHAVPYEGDPETKIIGGERATEEYAWTAALGGCGGTLVAPRWVVTAAHCVMRGGPRELRLASHNQREGGEVVRTDGRIIHPEYERNATHDIALIKLATPAKTTPIPIAAEVGPVGTQTRIMGWGDTNTTRPSGTLYLKQLDTSVVRAEGCKDVSGTPFDPSFEICTDNTNGNQGACFGDSGGPQVKKVAGRWELIGATSRGTKPCAIAPSIYTSVPDHIDWLREVSGNEIPLPGTSEPGPAPTDTPTTTPTATPTATPTSTPTTTPTATPSNPWPWPWPWPWPTPSPTASPTATPTATTTPTATPTTTPTNPTSPVTPNPNGRLITVDIDSAGQYRDTMIDAMNIWNAKVPGMNLQISEGGRADITVGTGPGWPYAAPRGFGAGKVHMGQKAMDDGHYALRVATHELGHIFGMPDRRTGKCEDLMAGSSAGTSCKNPNPSPAEISEVESYLERGVLGFDEGTVFEDSWK